MNDLSKLIIHVREAPNKISSSVFTYCLVSVSHIHYVYKVPYYSLLHFFVIQPKVVIFHFSPL